MSYEQSCEDLKGFGRDLSSCLTNLLRDDYLLRPEGLAIARAEESSLRSLKGHQSNSRWDPAMPNISQHCYSLTRTAAKDRGMTPFYGYRGRGTHGRTDG